MCNSNYIPRDDYDDDDNYDDDNDKNTIIIFIWC